MSRSQKSNTLYSHPFSKAYWRDAAAELKDTHMLVFAALMIALRLVMKQLAIPITPFLKINTAFFINALGAMVFGPVMAMLAACITDVLGYIIRPEGIYFLPFILTEVGGALVFALFLYRAKVTTTRVMLSRFTVSLVINEAQCVYRLMAEHTLRQRNIVLDTAIELWSIESIKRCVEGGLGVTYLPKFCMEKELREGTLRELPFHSEPETVTAVCAYHANKCLSPAAKLFLSLLQEGL